MRKAPVPPNETQPFPTATRALTRWLLSLFLSVISISAHAQLTYITNNGAITITGYDGYVGDLTIPKIIDGLPVKAIGVEAFKYKSNMDKVTIPSSVTSIGASAFFHCGLASVTIPSSVTNIGASAFSMCPGLQAISVEAGNPAYSSSLGVLFN